MLTKRKKLLALAKLIRMGCVVLYLWPVVFIIWLVFPRVKGMKLNQRYPARHWSKCLMRAFNIKMEVVGELPPRDSRYAIISNHVSYLDPMVMPQLAPVSFLSRHDWGKKPLLGWGAALGGVIYVNRGSRDSRLEARRKVNMHYAQGIRMVLYPEGATSGGSDLLPFRKAAFKQGLNIVPCGIKYRTDTGFDPAWYGAMPMLPHMLEALTQPAIECRLRIFPLMHARDFSDYLEYRKAVRDMIRDWVLAPWGKEEVGHQPH